MVIAPSLGPVLDGAEAAVVSFRSKRRPADGRILDKRDANWLLVEVERLNEDGGRTGLIESTLESFPPSGVVPSSREGGDGGGTALSGGWDKTTSDESVVAVSFSSLFWLLTAKRRLVVGLMGGSSLAADEYWVYWIWQPFDAEKIELWFEFKPNSESASMS